ncbi:MAG: hypothetical protein WBF38_06250 [Nitrosotalea sp.]
MNSKLADFFGNIRIFLAVAVISWPFFYGLAVAANESGLKLPYEHSPTMYIIISAFSVIFGVVAVVVEQKRSQEKEVAQSFRNYSNYIKTCSKIHQSYSNVMVLAKTPLLILPSEKNIDNDRKNYFEIIIQQIKKGTPKYHLQYLFDIDGYKNVLNGYISKNENENISQARKMIEDALRYDNLDLRYAKTSTLATAVIGSDELACIGFREKATSKIIVEGVRIHALEIVKVLKAQYEILFNEAGRVDSSFFDNVIDEIKRGKT